MYAFYRDFGPVWPCPAELALGSVPAGVRSCRRLDARAPGRPGTHHRLRLRGHLAARQSPLDLRPARPGPGQPRVPPAAPRDGRPGREPRRRADDLGRPGREGEVPLARQPRRMQLRYNYRLYPTPGHRAALARAFGCARVVFNDGLRIREQAHAAGLPYVTDGKLSARLTAVKAAPERAWLADMSAVILQQSLADLNRAYRNFFAWSAGRRKGPRIAPPRFKSRKRPAAGGPVHRQRPVQDPRQRAAAPAEDRGRGGPLVP